MQSQTFNLPAEMNNVVSATLADTANGDILFCHDQAFLYAAKISKVGGSVIFQRFNLPNLAKVIPVIKNYFIALFTSNKLVVFEVWFNEDNKVMLKYVFNKVDKPCISFFLREVVENMAELQLLYPDNQIYIYQFTVNGKVGHMEYVIGPQNKIKAERAQLYGSKTICCPQRKLFYYFSSFSSKVINSINLSKLENDLCEQMKTTLIAYICLPKIEEHYLILGNLNVVNLNNPGNRHKIQIAEDYQQDFSRLLQRKSKPTFRINTYFDLLLIQDSELMMAAIIHIKQKGSCLIAVEYGNFNWFWTSTRKLVGFSPTRNSFRMIETLKMNHRGNFIQEETASHEEGRANSLKHFKSQQHFIFKQENNEDLSKKWKEYTQKIMSDTNLPAKFIQNLKQSCAKSPDKAQSQHSEPPRNTLEEPAFIQKVSLPEKFVPIKVIQKKGVNVSKSISKPKEIEPIPKTETSFPQSIQTSQTKEIMMTVQAPAASLPNQEGVEVEQKQFEKPKAEEQSLEQKTLEKNFQPVQLQEKSKSEPSKLDQLPPAEKREEKAQQSKSEELMGRQQNQILSIIEEKLPIKEQKAQSKSQSQGQLLNASALEASMEGASMKGQENNLEQGQQKEAQANKDEKDNADSGIKKQQQKQSRQQDNIQKNLTLMIQRNMAGLQNSASNINRNKIFNNHVPIPIVPPSELKMKQTQSQNLEYYNPLLAHSPLSQKQLEVDPKEPYNIELPAQQQQQQHNEEVLSKIKQLFETTNVRLLKTLEDISTTSSLEPYLKERVREQIQDRVMDTLRKEIAGPFANRIQAFFSEIFRQTSAVQEESIKFYKEASAHKSGLIEVQLNNQEKILKEVKDIQNMIRFTIANLRAESTETHQNVIRDWATEIKEASKVVTSLETFKANLEGQVEQRNKRYEQTKKHLQAIKSMLIQRSNAEEERRQKVLENRSKKLKEQENKKRKKQGDERGRGGDKEKKVRLKKYGQV